MREFSIYRYMVQHCNHKSAKDWEEGIYDSFVNIIILTINTTAIPIANYFNLKMQLSPFVTIIVKGSQFGKRYHRYTLKI